MAALMSVPGVGPRMAQRLHECLGIETPADLAAAARSGCLRSLYGFGPKRTEQLGQLPLFGEPTLETDTADPRVRYIPRVGLCSSDMITAIHGEPLVNTVRNA